MKSMSMKGRLINALSMKPVDRIPVVSFTQTGTMDLMKKTTAYWPKAHRESKLMAKLGIAGHTVAGFEGVRIPFGLTAEAATLGCKIDYHDDKNDYTPNVKEGLKSIDDLNIPACTEGVTGEVIEATKIVKEKLNDDVPIIVGVTGPFTLAGHIRGVNQIMKDIIMTPSTVHKIEETTWQFVTNFGKTLHENGADMIAIIEPNASIIGPAYFKTFVLPYLKKVIAGMRAPTVLHICGNSLPIMSLMVETGVNGVSIDQKVSIAKAKAIVGGKAAVVGNVDPVAVLLDKKPDDVIKDCQRIIGEGTDALAPGCGLSPYTPLENIRAMVKTVKSSR